MKNSIKKYLNECQLNLNETQVDQLVLYANLLKNSKRKSFASWDSDKSGLEMHFKDSFLTLPKCKPNNILDIGSGAGIPGIIYSIIWRNTKACLLESKNNRVEFMKEAIKKLALEHRVKVIYGRAEELAHDELYRNMFDLVTARALAKFEVFVELCVAFVKKDGILYAIRGIKDKELFSKYKGFYLSLIEEKTYKLNNNSPLRWIAIFRKDELTPTKYPRRIKKIKKS